MITRGATATGGAGRAGAVPTARRPTGRRLPAGTPGRRDGGPWALTRCAQQSGG